MVAREPGPIWAKRAAADKLNVTEDNPTSSQSLLEPLSEGLVENRYKERNPSP